MYACTETNVRELVNDCTLASGEGHGSCGRMFHPIYAASPVSSVAERSVVVPVEYLHKLIECRV
jgi:hypothetical protein